MGNTRLLVSLAFFALLGGGGFTVLAWNYWVAIVLWLIALGIFLWGIWPKVKGGKKASVNIKNPHYYIVEQGKFTVELEAIIKCTNQPQQLANIQLVIAGKAHDFIKTNPPFEAEITAKSVFYRVCYEISYNDFLKGRDKNLTDVVDEEGSPCYTRKVLGRLYVIVDGEGVHSHVFEIWSKQEYTEAQSSHKED